MALHHEPLFSSKGGDSDLRGFWDLLYSAGADIVVSGHRHNYERFARQTPTGVANPDAASASSWSAPVAQPSTPSALDRHQQSGQERPDQRRLKLTLTPNSYDWQFVPSPGRASPIQEAPVAPARDPDPRPHPRDRHRSGRGPPTLGCGPSAPPRRRGGRPQRRASTTTSGGVPSVGRWSQTAIPPRSAKRLARPPSRSDHRAALDHERLRQPRCQAVADGAGQVRVPARSPRGACHRSRDASGPASWHVGAPRAGHVGRGAGRGRRAWCGE